MRNYFYERCGVCIEEECKKHGREPGSCKCKECQNLGECPKILHATIRITNRCTQKCRHCCFSSSPMSNIMMTPEMAKKINQFSEANGVMVYNVMGGEFFCNPRWHEILDTFLGSEVLFVRLVSNGDWFNRRDVKELLSDLFKRYQTKFKLSISKDKFHKNSWSDSDLLGFLKMTGGKYDVGTMEEMAVVPIGRAWLGYSFYSMMAKYCDQPCNRYSFLIDEEGQIYKCGFGVLPYANISEFLEGGFREVFKNLSQKFHKQPILNCKQCIGAYEDNSKIVEKRGFKLLRRE